MSGRHTHRLRFSAESQLLQVGFEGKCFGVRLRVEVERRWGLAGSKRRRGGEAAAAQFLCDAERGEAAARVASGCGGEG